MYVNVKNYTQLLKLQKIPEKLSFLYYTMLRNKKGFR